MGRPFLLGGPRGHLGRQLPDVGVRVVAWGHARTFDQVAVTAETGAFRLTGMLETLSLAARY